ncbi:MULTISPECIES: glycosyltransferase [Hungatella]|nr:glycosyltransferase [Hungatella hathewayi]
MKVLMINCVCGIRSTGRICTDLSEILESYGHECRIVYGRETIPEKYQHIALKLDSNIEIKINALKARIFDNEGFNAKKETKKLIEYIGKYKPDIIHLHNLHGYYLNIELLLGYLAERDIPVVYTMHDCWAITGHCAHFAKIKCEKWKTGCFNCAIKNEYPASFLMDSSKKNWEKKRALFQKLNNIIIVTPSEWLANILKQSYLKHQSIIVIPNGVDMEVFQPTESDFRKKYKLENKHIVLGVATAWNERKGLKEFMLLQKELDDSYQLVLVGLTQNQIQKLPDGVIGIERTNSMQELAGLYSTADIFVNAGQEETMGLTTVEAMACGTPAVVSDLTAVPEVIDSDGGLIFTDYSVECMAEKIRSAVGMSFPYTRRSAMRYEKKRQYEKYLELYETMITR